MHRAEAENFQLKIDSGEDLPEADVLDVYSDAFDLDADQNEVEWTEPKGDAKDMGASALRVYHDTVAPTVTKPIAVERKFTLRPEGVDWGYVGYIDLEEADGIVDDLKVVKSKISQNAADADLQATSTLLARRTEEQPANAFRFHTVVKRKNPAAAVVETTRTDAQLDAFLERLYRVSSEIAWRCEYDVWDGAPPGSWWCSEKVCGYWSDCQFGGRI